MGYDSFGNVFRATIINRKKNGELYHAQQTITPVTDPAGSITHFCSVIRDITSGVKAKEQLEQEIRRLAESNRGLEQFAYVARHDLKAPLRTVSNFTRLVYQRCRDTLDAESRELLEFVTIGIQQMNELIDGLLELSQVDVKGKPFELVEMTAVCEQVIASLHAAISESGAAVKYDNLPSVMGDRRTAWAVAPKPFRQRSEVPWPEATSGGIVRRA